MLLNGNIYSIPVHTQFRYTRRSIILLAQHKLSANVFNRHSITLIWHTTSRSFRGITYDSISDKIFYYNNQIQCEIGILFFINLLKF